MLCGRQSSGGDVLVVKKLLVALYQLCPQLLPELSTCTAPIDYACEVSHFTKSLRNKDSYAQGKNLFKT